MNFPEVQIDDESLKDILDLKWLGIESVTKFDEEDAVGKGENYGSIMRRLKITGTDSAGAAVVRNVVMKKDRILPEDVKLPIFDSEIKVYTTILPEMEKLIDETAARRGLEVLWPKCLGVRNYDLILLEDLVAAGYSMRNRRTPFSSNISIFCFGQLGKFHALSLVAIRRKMIDPNSLTSNKMTSDIPVVRNILSGGLYTLATKLETDPHLASVVPKLRDIADNIGDKLAILNEKANKFLSVINHGDCWINNLMIKNSKNTEEPISMRFVDYQNVHLNCFAWDVINFLHTSITAQTRQSCFKQIMENYRKSFIDTLEALHEDSSEVPSLDEMLRIMKEFNLYAVIAVCSLFPLTINTLEKPWEFEKAITNRPVNTHPPELYDNEIFKESFKLDAERFKRQGLL